MTEVYRKVLHANGVTLVITTDNEKFHLDEMEKGLEYCGETSFAVRLESPNQFLGIDTRQPIGNFTFAPFPGCCGIVVSHHTWLQDRWRNKPGVPSPYDISNAFREAKLKIAKDLGYSRMMATTVMDQLPAVSNMIKSKYEIIKEFTNSRTKNKVGIGIKVL